MHYSLLTFVALAAAAPGIAQSSSGVIGSNPGTAMGVIGQRQTREEAGANIRPMVRIESRVANRVQNRIRNRIDRNYDPRANAASPFQVANDQVRSTSR